jgi:hypothetical protein
MGRSALTAILTTGVVLALAALPATADPIAGATYNGIAADGASVSFTLTPDGTLINSYQITFAHGYNCTVSGAGGQGGGWQGAPIQNNSFDYSDATTTFQGNFTGAQSASGTLRLTTGPGGCDTGDESWHATTNATPPHGGGGGGNGGGGHGGKLAFATRVSLHTGSRKLLGGLRSSSRACLAGRTVVLWRGSRRMARTTSKAGGKFYFARKAMLRGRHVRASVLARTVQGGLCVAGSSKFIRG